MKLEGSQTEKNLLAAFAGESQARTRYTFFSSVAKKEGYEQISSIIQETSDNEKEHAQLFFNHLKGGTVEIKAAYPAGITGTTAQNLLAAAEGEKHEWGTLYPSFGEVAEREGFPDIAKTFRMVAKVESYHERRYRKLLANVEQSKVFKKDQPTKWKCRNCGFVSKDPKPLKSVPYAVTQEVTSRFGPKTTRPSFFVNANLLLRFVCLRLLMISNRHVRISIALMKVNPRNAFHCIARSGWFNSSARAIQGLIGRGK